MLHYAAGSISLPRLATMRYDALLRLHNEVATGTMMTQ